MSPTYYFQWQNPVLEKTIYPFRDKKLKDFLLYFKEVDLWKSAENKPVDAKVSSALVRERTKVKAQLVRAKLQQEKVAKDLKALEQKNRQTASSQEVRKLVYERANLESKLASQKAKMNTVKRRVEWYTQFAPDHPYFEKYRQEYALEQISFDKLNNELKANENAYNAIMGGFISEAKALNEKSEKLKANIQELTEQSKKLPSVDKNGEVSARAAVRWEVLQYEEQLAQKDQRELLQEILDKFDQDPQRFPIWLRYMVVHFSGMRYQSAHGSWADPKDLLESLKVEDLTQNIRALPKDELDKEVAKELDNLEKVKKTTQDKQELAKLERSIRLLNNQYQPQQVKGLLELQIERAQKEIQDMTENDVLDNLEAKKKQFPDWVWKEIASRTQLRLEVTDENWETLTKEETQRRWAWENNKWRGIMDAWERKDITGWRKQHERSLSLIVSRAVCNEVAEHIQHLRGLIPAGGLTSKPVWYLNNQKENPGEAYFIRPQTTDDLKCGASILFLGWVTKEPNAWQIAHPLSGADVLPESAKTSTVNRRDIVKGKGDTWKYRIDGNKFIRTSQPFINKVVNPPKVKTVKGPVIKEWLRWTHEATVVGVVEMTDGNYVMTFETGQIGVNLRPLSQILNRWDIFVGYIPEAAADPARLEGMLDVKKILPPPLPQVEVEAQPAISFGLPMVEEPEIFEERTDEKVRAGSPGGKDIFQLWQSLTRREKQVIALICQGYTTREVATRLDTSTSNINSHVSNAMGKFGVKHRESLCAWLADWDFESVEV
ncbi:MAG: LuxR C-terminal-related transcriptional regulator [Anaerolineales bacterium]